MDQISSLSIYAPTVLGRLLYHFYLHGIASSVNLPDAVTLVV